MKILRSVPIIKINDEKRVLKGPVLRPEIEDRHGTVISKEVIEAACWDFMERMKAETQKTGPKLMHEGEHNDEVFNEALSIVESYITDEDMTYKVVQAGGEDTELFVPAGSWMMAMKVHDDEIWRAVKDGHFRGFSIGGVADKLELDEAA